MTPSACSHSSSFAQIIHLLLNFSTWVWAGDIQNYVNGQQESWYPTSFTRDIVPKPLHSHNDYWRKVPLFDAISVGCISVEADIWKFDGDDELYVGHELSSLTKNRTLNSLYIEPLISILARQNPTTEFVNGSYTYNGIFDTSPSQTLNLYLDLKTDPDHTYPAILRHLYPLARYLTYHDPSSSPNPTTHHGPITVTLTGNAPFDNILALDPSFPPGPYSDSTKRYVFFDASLVDIEAAGPNGKYNWTNSVMGTAQFSKAVGRIALGGMLSEKQREILKRQVAAAHERGIGARYWDTPAWPVRTRNRVWRELIELGVDLLNVDDLRGAGWGMW
ncbi:hypothetical protein BDZ91DRAFT_345631 [Kalaharituber pfeilii]|nr:hypothetical protein BDZ91DRAFT_345631 [Kalaharituber pfeilii]